MKLIKNFDVGKNYKLYRVIQKIINPKIGVKQYIDIEYKNGNRSIPLRIFNPMNAKKIIIYIHGGGWIAGNLDTHSSICYTLAKKTNRKIISIGYSLAPENPFPCGFDDCYSVVLEIMNNIKDFSLTWNDIVLMGDSAGGNLCAAVSQKGLKEHQFRVGKQVLIYPALQSDYSKNTKYKSVLENDEKGFLRQSQLVDFINSYVKDKKDLKNIYVAPLFAKRLFGLPKTLIITGTNDPLHDEGIAYAKKLKRHLVSVKSYDIKDAPHGFMTNIMEKRFTELTIQYITDFIQD